MRMHQNVYQGPAKGVRPKRIGNTPSLYLDMRSPRGSELHNGRRDDVGRKAAKQFGDCFPECDLAIVRSLLCCLVLPDKPIVRIITFPLRHQLLLFLIRPTCWLRGPQAFELGPSIDRTLGFQPCLYRFLVWLGFLSRNPLHLGSCSRSCSCFRRGRRRLLDRDSGGIWLAPCSWDVLPSKLCFKPAYLPQSFFC